MPTIAIYAIAAIALFAGGFGVGVKVTSDSYKAAELDQQKQVVADIKAEVKHDNDASAQLEERKDEQRIVYKTITRTVDRIVEKPVYRDVCLDADGLRAANAALGGPPAVAGKPDAALPKPDAARGRDAGGGAAQAR